MVGMKILRMKTPLVSLPPMTPSTMFLLLLVLISKANNLKEKKRMNIKTYCSTFTATTFANATSSQPSLTQPTLDKRWKRNARKMIFNTLLYGGMMQCYQD